MANPNRLMVMLALRDRLRQITRANGYEMELAGEVYLGRLVAGDEAPDRYISIWEPWDEDGPADELVGQQGRSTPVRGKVRYTIKVFVHGFVRAETNDPTIPAHQLLGCILKALGPVWTNPQETIGATGFASSQGVVRPPDNLSENAAYCLVPLYITLIETIGDPYGQ